MDAFKTSTALFPAPLLELPAKPKLKGSSSPNNPKIPLHQKFFVGASAGILGTSLIYPIDLLKTRLQSAATGESFASTFRRVIRGGGLYRGFSACLIGIAPEKAIKLAVNDGARDFFTARNAATLATPSTTSSGILLHQEILAGSLAGFLQLFVTVPYESVKIQLQMAQGEARESPLSVVRRMGWAGVYRGFTATLCRDVPFCILFFPLYANVKDLQTRATLPSPSPSSSLSLMETPLPSTAPKEPFHVGLVAGIVAGAISAALVTPADMLKTRIQQGMNGDRRFLAYARDLVREEGAAALFKGWQARVAVIAPLYGLVSLAFEVQKQWLASP